MKNPLSLKPYTNPIYSGSYVIRGGRWNTYPTLLRISKLRGKGVPYLDYNYVGFRLFRSEKL